MDLTQKDQEVFDYWSSQDSPKVQKYLEWSLQFEAGTALPLEDERFLSKLIIPAYKGMSVIDVGAGPGRLVQMFTKADCRLTATDWSDSFVSRLEIVCQKYGARALKYDICSTPLPEKFDLVFSTQLMLHLHPSKIEAAVVNMAAMAKRDIVLVTWQGNPPYDDNSTTKVQSFNHDYSSLFKKLGLKLDIELDIYFQQTNVRRRVTNKVFLLIV